ncbi:MAG: glycogen/starch/alpha-glucan phosphorylase [Planctomycetes bacterium]|nr:glycogen/starch/alpha-glucan phosphorylase [Planctomycetota bacterium]
MNDGKNTYTGTPTRIGMDPESIKRGFCNHLRYDLALDDYTATSHDKYLALAGAVRDRLVERWITTQQTYYDRNAKRIYYLSMEFLIGRSLGNNVSNLKMDPAVGQAMEELSLRWEELRDEELDAGLGNGGLGRLAACFLESMATMDLPSYGYGIRYEHGIFRQKMENGYQVEEPDSWLREGNPWEIARPDRRVSVHFGGQVETFRENGHVVRRWVDTHTVWGIPYDMPIVGYGGKTVTTLRLWSAASPDEFDFEDFNQGDYVAAVDHKVMAENITKVLYPNDNVLQGKELRLRQQYFFVACAMHDVIRRFKKNFTDWNELPNQVAIQLNDTHPTLAIPEMMRLLVDREGLEFEHAWDLTVRCMGYTNHTLLPEALETWPVDMFETLLPRHVDIIYDINYRFLKQVGTRFPGDTAKRIRMSLVQDEPVKHIRMANLAIVGSHSTNGVAELHSKLLASRVVPDFAEMYPERFNNKTNGVTPRRWLLKANPPLAGLITEAIGDGWITDLTRLAALKPLADDAAFRQRFMQVKRQSKVSLSNYCRTHFGFTLNLDSIYDIHIKRIHAYKRQLLNALHIVMLYNRLRQNPSCQFTPQTFLFAGKAAPGYFMAKLIIKLINSIAEIVNSDPAVNSRLAVHFLPNYRVSLAERMIPAADVSEQISTAGTEASGTGNMKFMMNGALTLGTMDGANIEIVQEAGIENAFIFGLSAQQVEESRSWYSPMWHYENDGAARQALDMIFSDSFNVNEPDIFKPIKDYLLKYGDEYMHLADLAGYADAQRRIQAAYADRDNWARMAILNIASSGKFSSDRTIAQYAKEIWNVVPCPVPNGQG